MVPGKDSHCRRRRIRRRARSVHRSQPGTDQFERTERPRWLRQPIVAEAGRFCGGLVHDKDALLGAGERPRRPSDGEPGRSRHVDGSRHQRTRRPRRATASGGSTVVHHRSRATGSRASGSCRRSRHRRRRRTDEPHATRDQTGRARPHGVPDLERGDRQVRGAGRGQADPAASDEVREVWRPRGCPRALRPPRPSLRPPRPAPRRAPVCPRCGTAG